MLYELTQWLQQFESAFRLFNYLTFRAILAILTALVFSFVFGPWLIRRLTFHQIGQVIRPEGPQTHLAKAGTLSTAFAQRREITNVSGRTVIANISPEQAREKAIELAKAEALRQAGAEEWVQSFDFLQKVEQSNKFEEFFHSLTSVQSMGSVVDWKVRKEHKGVDEFGALFYEVTLDATVVLYKTRPDPSFQLTVKGIHPVYKNEEKMNFEVFPGQDGFLKIFLLDEARAVSQLYPNEHEPQANMKGSTSYKFPQSPHFNYEVYTEKKEETNYLFLVYTRKDIPYKGGDDFAGFIEYVYSMEPVERFVALERISIRK
jgi:hypothetical protein